MITEKKLLENLEKANIKEESYKDYLSKITVMKSWRKKNGIKLTLLYLLKNPEETFKLIESMTYKKGEEEVNYKDTSKAKYFSALYSLIKHNPNLKDEVSFVNKSKDIDKVKIWQDKAKEYKEKGNTENYAVQVEIDEDLYSKACNKVLSIRKKMLESNKSWKEYQKYLLLEVITQLLPKRCELREVYLVNENNTTYEDEEDGIEYKYDLTNINHILIKPTGELTLKLPNYKNSKDKDGNKKKETIEEVIPIELSNIIRDSLKKYKRRLLFTKNLRDNSVYKQNSYTTLFESATEFYLGNSNVGPSRWRHYFTTYYLKLKDRNNEDIDRIAKLMGTSYIMLMRVYRDKVREDKLKETKR